MINYGPFIFSILLWIGTGIFCRACLPPFEKGTDKELRALNWALIILLFCLSTIVSYINIETNINKAVIDYDRGKYKVELKVQIDTIRTVERCPELSKHIVPPVTKPQTMKSTLPMTMEKEVLRDSALPYSQWGFQN